MTTPIRPPIVNPLHPRSSLGENLMLNTSRTTRLALIGLMVSAVILVLALLQFSLAAAAPTAAGVTVQPTSDAKSGAPGTYVSYTVRVTNTGSETDIFTLTVTGQVWATDIVVIPGTIIIPNTTVLILLNSGEFRDVVVWVFIPYTVAGGTQDVTTFRARSQNDPTLSAIATLTTTATHKLYLPIVLKP